MVRCWYFAAGECRNGDDCVYSHEQVKSSMKAAKAHKTLPCKHFEKGKCKDGDECKFIHAEEKKSQSLCKHFERGECKAGDQCKFIHVRKFETENHKVVLAVRKPCKMYEKGTCKNGTKCKFLHVEPVEEQSVVKPSAYKSVPCRHFYRGACKDGDSCTFIHDVSSDEMDMRETLANKKLRTVPCRHFKKGFCKDGDSCNFLHAVEKISEIQAEKLAEYTPEKLLPASKGWDGLDPCILAIFPVTMTTGSESGGCCACCNFSLDIVKGTAVVELPCNHLMHHDCCYQWFKKQAGCPTRGCDHNKEIKHVDVSKMVMPPDVSNWKSVRNVGYAISSCLNSNQTNATMQYAGYVPGREEWEANTVKLSFKPSPPYAVFDKSGISRPKFFALMNHFIGGISIRVTINKLPDPNPFLDGGVGEDTSFKKLYYFLVDSTQGHVKVVPPYYNCMCNTLLLDRKFSFVSHY